MNDSSRSIDSQSKAREDARPGTDSAERTHTDPRKLVLHRAQPARDVPYVPSDDDVVAQMLDLAEVTPDDVVYDLGCGDGRIVIAAAKRGARAIGVDIDLLRIRESYENAKRAGVADRCQFLRQSFFDTDVREATVVTMYLLPGINVRLRPKLMLDLRPGARIVCNNFDLGDWPSDARVLFHYRSLQKWIVPAWVSGRWRCVIDDPRGRRHMTLVLERRFQTVIGTAHLERRKVTLTQGRLAGGHLTFVVDGIRFSADVKGHTMRGVCRAMTDGSRDIAWGAIRE